MENLLRPYVTMINLTMLDGFLEKSLESIQN